MDLRESVSVAVGARTARRRKSHFVAWKSFIGKKATAEASAKAEERASEVPVVRRLTVGLIDTYEAINAAYYERRQRAAQQAAEESHLARAIGGLELRREQELPGSATTVDESVPLEQVNAHSADDMLSNVAQAPPLNETTTASAESEAPAQRSSAPPESSAGGESATGLATSAYCDSNYDYVVRAGDVFNSRYVLEKVIGRGSFGQVVRAYDRLEGEHVAVKIIKANALYVEQAASEVRMTSYLNRIDPHDEHAIMRLRDRFVYRGHQCLVLELLSFSLYDLLRSTEFYGVSLNLVRKFARQILRCLAFLARPSVRVAHCDLKPENVLLRHPQRSAIKVVDFGASARVSDTMFTYVQSRFYRAPEVILGLPYDTQVDVWSLGCMLVELHTGYPLFAGRDEGDQMAVIVERCGLPPQHMLDAGKKTALFFDRLPDGDGWVLKKGIAQRDGDVTPGSRPVRDFVHELTANGGGKGRRADAANDPEYAPFLALCEQMLALDPNARTDAEAALRAVFFTGGNCSGSGNATTSSPCVPSPPPARRTDSPRLPELDAKVSESVPELQPGRKAPVQQTARRGVQFDVDDAQSDGGNDRSAASVSGHTKSDPFGGDLRLSKSETAIGTYLPAVDDHAPAPYALHASSWAEQVGIDPPPWRAEELGTQSRRRRRRPNAGAGGGRPRHPTLRAHLCPPQAAEPVLCPDGPGAESVCDSRCAARAATAVSATPGTRHAPFPMGIAPPAVAMALCDARARRMAAATKARPPPLRVAGHGDALLLRREQADERRLALANTQPAALYF